MHNAFHESLKPGEPLNFSGRATQVQSRES